MPINNESVRQKVWRTKVHTGCITCKIRRVRCDEEKPNCKRCTSTGRKCDGYETITEARQRSQRSKRLSQSSNVILPTRNRILIPAPNTGLGLHLSSNPQEVHSFKFFCTVAAPSFSTPVDGDFWVRLLPQACHSNRAIWHAVTTLGALHECFIAGKDPHLPERTTDQRMEFALKQFNVSIKHLIEHSAGATSLTTVQNSTANKRTALTVCILFTCICNLQGLQKQALVHLQGGLSLLGELQLDLQMKKESLATDLPVPLVTLSTILTGLDNQARSIIDDATLASWNVRPLIVSHDQPVTGEYSNLTQLAIAAESFFNGILQFVQHLEVDPLSPEGIAKILLGFNEKRVGLSKLRRSLATLATKSQPMDAGLKRSATLIEIDIVVSHIYLSLRPNFGERMWDFHEAHFQRLYELCGQYLEPTSNATGLIEGEGEDSAIVEQTARPPEFLPRASTTQALFLTGTRCRNPIIRRRAIQLLQQYPRREGLWDSKIACWIAAQVVTLEESKSGWDNVWQTKQARDLVDDALVRDVAVTFINDRRATVQIRTCGDHRVGSPGIKYQTSW